MLAALFVIVSIFGGGTIFIMAGNHEQVVLAREEKERIKEMDSLELLKYYTNEIRRNKEISEFDEQVRIQLPNGIKASQVQYSSDYHTRTISIRVPTSDPDYFYDYPMVGKSDKMETLSMQVQGNYAVIEATLDGIYELASNQKEGYDNYVYVDFVKPKEIYDKVVVIDAGHGGNDGGAVEGGITEKEINLGILLKLKAIFDGQQDIKAYYTRENDTNPSLQERAALANEVEADFFISIHNNTMSYASASYVNGTEVMYNEEYEGDENLSMEFAKICLDAVTRGAGSKNQGLEKGHSIYVVRTADMPAALVEVGFMSNAGELKKLASSKYQKKCAGALYRAVLVAYEQIGGNHKMGK